MVKMSVSFLRSVVIIQMMLCTVPAPAAADDLPILLKPGRVFTAGDSAVREGWAVLVTEGRIAAVGPAGEIVAPPGTQVVELPGTTLLPGLVDLHVHLFLHPYNEASWDDQVLKEPVEYRTIAAVEYAAATLAAGFTTVRDLGTEGAGYADVSLKRALDEGRIAGPRLEIATLAIVAAGCYGPGPRGWRPDLDLRKGAQEVSGEAEIVRAVREQAARGADWIKVYADYRCGPGGKAVPAFSQRELDLLVATAHDLGRKVAAHAVTPEGMRRAVSAGVQTIEHGFEGNDEVFRLMAERGVVYLPTLAAQAAYAEYFDGYKPGDEPTAGMRDAKRAFRAALKAGVTIGAGGDAGVFAHGANALEIEWMVRYGMRPEHALLAATATGARTLGRENEIGRIRPGLIADLVAVEGDPVTDIAALHNVSLVMQGGRIVKTPHAAIPPKIILDSGTSN